MGRSEGESGHRQMGEADQSHHRWSLVYLPLFATCCLCLFCQHVIFKKSLSSTPSLSSPYTIPHTPLITLNSYPSLH